MLDISAMDYTIMVKNIPIEFDALNNDYDDDLLAFFTKQGLAYEEVEVAQVTLSYNMSEVIEIQK